MLDELPDRQNFCKRLAEMHKRSIELAESGKLIKRAEFGCEVETYEGKLHQHVQWSDSWEEFFIASMKNFVAQERRVHGQHDALTRRFRHAHFCASALYGSTKEFRDIKPEF